MSSGNHIENTVKSNHNVERLYALCLTYPHKQEICLINHIEYGFIFDGILNQAILNIFERKNFHPEYYHSSEEILTMLPEQRAKLLIQNEFSSLAQLYVYCEKNNIDIISVYELIA